MQKQQDAFSDCIEILYQKTPNLLSERRTIESEKRQCLNVKYTAAGVERTWRVSTSATKVRGASPCSTILSSREDDRDNDASLVATNHVPVTRSKKGKRGGSKADVPALKVRTRSLKSRKSSRFNVHQHSTCSVVSPGASYYATLIMCLHVVSDGRGRKTREIAGWSQSGVLESTASSQMSTPAGKSRDRVGHTCAESSVHMFHFFVETGEPSNHVLEVWDRAGQELFKMTGQEFFDKYGSDVESLLPDRAESAVQISSSHGRSSLEVLLRLQTRVKNLSFEIAEAIASVKLEQEEEFTDSACDWAEL
ncbi:hypothetical protein R1sor_026753 [Riccia sorocarpa]|uniref:Uncharacterized protein n=1 Tax=Riccia sorocarpa TaxID=122646 RepID=A0ABD3GFF1_9MARC